MPALVGHDDVHQDHVGLQRTCLEDRVARGARLADRLEVVLGVEQEPQAGADDGVIVDDEDADAQSGTSATSVVPRSSLDSTSSRPSSRRDAFAHALEAEAAVAVVRRVESLAVVLDHRRNAHRPSR